MTHNSQQALPTARYYWLDYLRGLNIVGTLLFHSVLAYSPFVQATGISYLPIPFADLTTSFPIADIFLLVRPIFSMQLMFFISGLFTWRSLIKRGPRGYIVARFKRLILPLILTWLIVMPLTYLPAYYEQQLTFFPIRLAHLWFLWVLFSFDLLIAFLFSMFRLQIETLVFRLNNIRLSIFSGFFVVVAYLSFVYQAGNTGWLPIAGSQVFLLPAAWIGLYLFYFLLGVLMGSRCLNTHTINTYWLCPSANSSNGLMVCSIISLSIFGAFLFFRANVTTLINNTGSFFAWSLINILYALSGLLIVTTTILFSKRYLKGQNHLLDNLSVNSYGFYLVHYTFVVWSQFFLSRTIVMGFWKPFVVILLCIPLSWFAAEALRRLPLIRSLIVSV